MLAKTIARKVLSRLEETLLKRVHGVPPFEIECFGSYADYRESQDRSRERDAGRARAEQALIPDGSNGPFWVRGYCAVCRKWTRFAVDYGFAQDIEAEIRIPNWRESLLCPGCWLNNRMRACFQLFRDQLGPSPDASIYMPEQITTLFALIKDRYPNTIGSEFMADGTPPGATNAAGIRFEDLTRLSFGSDQFDFVLSFEVIEHVPDYRAALVETVRVLKPGGTMLLTTPFHGEPTTTVRARLGPEGIEHLLPPEYHGDPLASDGCLSFYTFGGDLIDSLHQAGFREVSINLVYSRDLGYLLRANPIFIARK